MEANEHTKENWYALKVFFNRVFEIEKILQAAGVESYIPIKRVTRETKQGKVTVLKPLIPSLMFFRSTEEYAIELQKKLTDRAIVYSNLEKKPNRRPGVIPEREMEFFKMITSVGDEGLEFFPEGAFDYKDGQKVRVIGGVFEGVEGVIKRIKHNRRLIVSLKGVCMVATSYIPPSLLEVIE